MRRCIQKHHVSLLAMHVDPCRKLATPGRYKQVTCKVFANLIAWRWNRCRAGAYAQLQALLGEAHVNIVTAKEVALTAKHVCLLMEFAAGGNMTSYVAKKSQGSTAAAAEGQLFMTEDEARYFYRVRMMIALHHMPDTCVAYV